MRGNSFKIVGLALLVGACATARPPAVQVKYVDRPILVQKECVQKGDVPSRPQSLGATPHSLEVVARLALAKVAEYEAYANKADPIMASCSS